MQRSRRTCAAVRTMRGWIRALAGRQCARRHLRSTISGRSEKKHHAATLSCKPCMLLDARARSPATPVRALRVPNVRHPRVAAAEGDGRPSRIMAHPRPPPSSCSTCAYAQLQADVWPAVGGLSGRGSPSAGGVIASHDGSIGVVLHRQVARLVLGGQHRRQLIEGCRLGAGSNLLGVLASALRLAGLGSLAPALGPSPAAGDGDGGRVGWAAVRVGPRQGGSGGQRLCARGCRPHLLAATKWAPARSTSRHRARRGR